jgi:hypothetical protein
MSAPKLVAVAAAAVMLVGWSVRSFVVDDDSTGASTVAASTAAGVGTDLPTKGEVVAVATERGIPVGYPQSDRGAATAAVNWVASFPALMKLNPLSLQNALVEVMSAQGAVTFIDNAVADYVALLDALGPGAQDRMWIESPLQSTVFSASATAASVGVWSVVVSGGVDDAAVTAGWRTHRIELVWERDDWKIAEVVVVEGPTPVGVEAALPSPSADFTDIASWEPAVFVDTTKGED